MKRKFIVFMNIVLLLIWIWSILICMSDPIELKSLRGFVAFIVLLTNCCMVCVSICGILTEDGMFLWVPLIWLPINCSNNLPSILGWIAYFHLNSNTVVILALGLLAFYIWLLVILYNVTIKSDRNARCENTRNANIEANLGRNRDNLHTSSAPTVNEIRENNSNEATEATYRITVNLYDQNAAFNCRRFPSAIHMTHRKAPSSTNNTASYTSNHSNDNAHPVPSHSSHDAHTSSHNDTDMHRITPVQFHSTNNASNDVCSTGGCEIYAPD